jgi:tetratricopeptide (TPR) repeat protein
MILIALLMCGLSVAEHRLTRSPTITDPNRWVTDSETRNYNYIEVNNVIYGRDISGDNVLYRWDSSTLTWSRAGAQEEKSVVAAAIQNIDEWRQGDWIDADLAGVSQPGEYTMVGDNVYVRLTRDDRTEYREFVGGIDPTKQRNGMNPITEQQYNTAVQLQNTRYLDIHNRADSQYRSGNYQQVLNILQNEMLPAAADDVQRQQVLYGIGVTQMQLGNTDAAAESFSDAYEMNPDRYIEFLTSRLDTDAQQSAIIAINGLDLSEVEEGHIRDITYYLQDNIDSENSGEITDALLRIGETEEGRESAIEQLKSALEYTDQRIRDDAALALGLIGTNEAIAAIRDAEQQGIISERTAAQAIGTTETTAPAAPTATTTPAIPTPTTIAPTATTIATTATTLPPATPTTAAPAAAQNPQVKSQNIKNIVNGTQLIVDGQQVTVVSVTGNISTSQSLITIRYTNGTTSQIPQAEILSKYSFTSPSQAAVTAAPAGRMNVATETKPINVLSAKDARQLQTQMLREGYYNATVLANAQFAVDKYGNVFMQRPPVQTNYIRTSTGRYAYTSQLTSAQWNSVDRSFRNLYNNNSANVRFDPATGQIYQRRNNRTRWEQSSDPRRIVTVGTNTYLASQAYSRDIALPSNMVQYRTGAGQPYTYYYYDSGNRTWQNLDSNAGREMLRNATLRRFGANWSDRFAGGNATQTMENIDRRLNAIQFWTTFFEGSPDLLYQTVEDRLVTTWGWDDTVAEWDWLEEGFWQPEEWETEICEGLFDFEGDTPESVNSGNTEYGPAMTMRLEGKKQAFPDNTTLYTTSWLVTPSLGSINYTVCYGTCSYCIPLQNSTIIEAPFVSSGFTNQYIPSNITITHVSICYTRTVNEQIVEANTFERPIIE